MNEEHSVVLTRGRCEIATISKVLEINTPAGQVSVFVCWCVGVFGVGVGVEKVLVFVQDTIRFAPSPVFTTDGRPFSWVRSLETNAAMRFFVICARCARIIAQICYYLYTVARLRLLLLAVA